ncbi:MAG: hypothetical protein CVU77_06560 [Elusimicrobia bacterium HGW-Elusimicrobia-1]|jgi:tetratricopeptide (TPR) repeat protein|nr:MAG: hypothetical protein CVU77_06560 [Elusimicrobia bacterium HGW-Elusimicrobia-1]
MIMRKSVSRIILLLYSFLLCADGHAQEKEAVESFLLKQSTSTFIDNARNWVAVAPDNAPARLFLTLAYDVVGDTRAWSQMCKWRKKSDDVLAYTEEIVRTQPRSPRALGARAYTLYVLERNDAALENIDKAIALDNDDSWLSYTAAMINYRLRNYKTAGGQFLRAIELEPDNPRKHKALSFAGAALYWAQDYGASGQCFERLLESQSGDFYGLSWLARVYEKSGKYKDALETYENALRAKDKSGPGIEEIKGRIAKLKGIKPLPPIPVLASPDEVELQRGEIIITTIGDVDGEMVSAVAAHLEKIFRFKARIMPPISIPPEAYNAQKDRYRADILSEEVGKKYGYDIPHILALTNLDLIGPDGKRWWSWGAMGFGVQVVSPRMFKTHDKERFLHRTLVATQKRVAHTFGIPTVRDKNNFAFSPARGSSQLDVMSLALAPGQASCAEFTKRYAREISYSTVTDETIERLSKESESGGWISSVLYAWALMERYALSGDSPNKEKLKLAENILLRSTAIKPAEAFARLGLAIIYGEAGDGIRSSAEASKAVKLNSTVQNLFYFPGRAALSRGDYVRAAILLDREYFLQGIYVQKYIGGSEYRLELFAAEISSRPRLFNAGLTLSNYFYHIKEYDKAAAILDKTLSAANPAYSRKRRYAAWGHNHLAWTYTNNLETKLDDALLNAKIAVSLEPKCGAYIDTLGWTYYKMGNYKKALPLLKKASKLDPDPEIKEHIKSTEAALKKPPLTSAY